MSFPKNEKIWLSRKLLQNPYAHIDEIEGAIAPDVKNRRGSNAFAGTQSRKYYGLGEIERLSINFQRALWGRRVEYGVGPDSSPVDILNPEIAAKFLGYEYSYSSSLGWFSRGKKQIVVAGIIDRSRRVIEISTDVEPRMARFTAAHEIGHAILHPNQSGLHRDRPIGGATEARNRIEYEADKFATFFLMPEKHLLQEFSWRFILPFELQEETAYALLGKPYEVAQEILPTLRHVARELAGATQFNGCGFTSLADYFGVSVETMAIRLEELALIKFEN
jgi:Zn-dependent peptidase ImmA (M78 family)